MHGNNSTSHTHVDPATTEVLHQSHAVDEDWMMTIQNRGNTMSPHPPTTYHHDPDYHNNAGLQAYEAEANNSLSHHHLHPHHHHHQSTPISTIKANVNYNTNHDSRHHHHRSTKNVADNLSRGSGGNVDSNDINAFLKRADQHHHTASPLPHTTPPMAPSKVIISFSRVNFLLPNPAKTVEMLIRVCLLTH